MSARRSSPRARLLGASFPLLGLLSDLLAAQQGEVIWRYGAVAASLAATACLLWGLSERRRRAASLTAAVLLAGSGAARLVAPLPAEAQLATGVWLATAAVALLLLSGALLEGLADPDQPLREALEAEPSAPAPGAKPMGRAA